MSDIIGKWLTETLGIIVEVYSETFVRLMQNGYLVAAILRHYNIISADQLTSLTSAGDSTNAFDKIAVWLKQIDICVDDHARDDLQKGKLSAALELFYKLYLAFQGKDPLHFNAKQVQTEKLRDVKDRFEVSPVIDDVPLFPDAATHTSANTLSDFNHIVEWHRGRYEQLIQRCEETRRNYAAFIARKEKREKEIKYPKRVTEEAINEIRLNEDDEKSLVEDYEQLLEQQHKAQEMNAFETDERLSRKIVKSIKKKLEKERTGQEFQTRMGMMVMSQFWDDLLIAQSKRIEGDISQKMLKQSYYEKQMINKMFQVREQKEVMAENRIALLHEIQEKKDEELLERVFAREKDSADARYRYYFERDRAMELHRIMYEEKQRLKTQRKRDMCESILEDLVDIAFWRADYRSAFEEDMPRRMLNDLAALFLSGQPIFDLVPNEEVIIEYEPTHDASEEIYLDEIERHNAMDARSFEQYCNFEWPWELELHVPDYAESDVLYEIQMAANILGHVVFRLLLAKYPKPPMKPPPNIPKVHVAVCINNLSDATVLPILSKLLSERGVKVLQMEDAVNYCLEAYKSEIVTESPESQFVDETQVALKKTSTKKKDKKKGNMKKKGEKKNTKKPVLKDVDSTMLEGVQEKQVQTPRIFPCEEVKLTAAGELGRLAYEILNLGEGLNDRLAVQIFVEYLKTLSDIDGWVLINYPNTFEQMTLLEEALTAKPVLPPAEENDRNRVPQSNVSLTKGSGSGSLGIAWLFSSCVHSIQEVDRCQSKSSYDRKLSESISNNDTIADVANLEFREVKQNECVVDKNARFRVSQLLTNPDPPTRLDDYDTYLTAFIKLEQNLPSKVDLQRTVISTEGLGELDLFYQEQGCLYNLYYKVLDLATIKHLGKLIIGDYKLPPKTSVEIFGDIVLYLENDMNQFEPVPGKVSKSKSGGGKKEKKAKPQTPKAQKAKVKDVKDKKEKAGKKDKKAKKDNKSSKLKKKGGKGGGDAPDVLIIREDKQTQMPEGTPTIEELFEFDLPQPTPGQPEWRYSDLPVPEFFQVALATLWEVVEEIFVSDFKELFFRRRVLWKSVMPYLNFIKRHMRDFIARPDDKQIHLYNFQRLYNEIAADMRDDEEVKAEVHCRVQEFREKMWQICDQRMRESEEERGKIIMQDWVTKQACELTAVYVTAMQLEIDRCADTLQLLNDYYAAMITQMPCQEEVLQKVPLDYIKFKDDFEFDNYHVYSAFVRNGLTRCDADPSRSPYHEHIMTNYKVALAAVDNYQSKSLDILAGMENYFQPKAKRTKTKKEIKSKGKPKLPKFSAPNAEVKEVGLNLIGEWSRAVKGEYARVCLRLGLLKSVAHEDLGDMLASSMRMFQTLFGEIKKRYDTEMESVTECCDVISRAIEEEMPIQPELVLSNGKFCISPNVLLFDDPLPEPGPFIREYEKPEAFNIEQLSFLTDVFLDLAPSGIMPERAFTFLLQDAIVNNAEDGKPPLVPVLWQQLPSRRVNRLSYEFFGHTELIDWKDFIVQNLCLDFPDEMELMQTRNRFRELDVDANEYVYDYQFETVRLWFETQFNEEDPNELLRLRKMKKLLFKLYRISEDKVNYTALLLAFCKDLEGYMGVAKSLQLSLGKFVCWDSETGEKFVEILQQKRLEKLQEKMRLEVEEAEKTEMVNDIVDNMIDATVHQCDSCFLEPWYSDDSKKSDADCEDNVRDEIMEPELVYLEKLMNEYEMRYQYEENAPQYLLQEQFSNVEIGFEPELYPLKVYYLPFEALITVMMAAMPWQAVSKIDGELSTRQKLARIYEECKREEFDGVVLMHEFLHCEALQELFMDNFKFEIRRPGDVIRKLLR